MDAIAVGSLYALIALGYTMVYGILKFINFAHSDVFVLGAWVSFSAAMCAGYGTDAHGSPIATWVLLAIGAVSVGAAKSRARWPRNRNSSCSTSRWPASIRSPWATSASWFAT